MKQLEGAVLLMERRYELIRAVDARNFVEANDRLVDRGLERVSSLLVVIDELEELVLNAPKRLQALLVRLARDGPPAGVHVVFTTRARSDRIALETGPRPSAGGIPGTLEGLRRLTCWTHLAAGQPDQLLAFVAADQAVSVGDARERQRLAQLGELRRPIAVAKYIAGGANSMIFMKSAALKAKGLTDAALVVYDDAIRQGTQPDAPRSWRWVGQVRYAKSALLTDIGDISGARRELARLYADFPDWIDEFGLLGQVGPANIRRSGRSPIAEEVRHAVWRRDQGRCALCGSRERLEFDHVIPLSRGGANTERNLQLLCEACNRRKGARI